MKNEFVTYQQALKLKELRFDEPSFGYYTHNEKLCKYNSSEQTVEFVGCTHYNIYNTYSLAPLKQQVFRWFREKGYYGEIFVDDDKTFGYYITNFVPLGRVSQPIKRGFISYEEAETNCIDKLIELFYGTEITE